MHLINRNVTIAIILLALVGFISLYRSFKIDQIEKTLIEHTLVVAEPMWNFDTDRLEKYLHTVTERYNYDSLKIFDEDGRLFYDVASSPLSKFDRPLNALGLVPLERFEKEIVFNNELLGTLEVVWRDTSIYIYAHAFLVSLLLIIITCLYAGVVNAKRILEDKITIVEQAVSDLQSQKEYIENIFNLVPEGLITIDKDKNTIDNNHFFDSIIESWATALNKEYGSFKEIFLAELQKHLRQRDKGQYSLVIDDCAINLEFISATVPSISNIDRVVSLRDITKLTVMERQLSQSQKLEAVGRLASGIAHEINTPTQYVLSNIDFLTETHQDIAEVMAKVEQLTTTKGQEAIRTILEDVGMQYQEVDWKYLAEEIPKALEQSKEGLRRITKIVGAMKHFSHPSGNTAEMHDLNMAIENTVAVATNEWKYAAVVDLRLDQTLPQVPCYLDELNQVFLGMIVNSAHAIEEKNGKNSGQKGTITIKTSTNGDHFVISLTDDGIGMTAEVMKKVFDPFFTTKELNKGTGQGLAIAHDVITNRHRGSIVVTSKPNIGTTFTISLPINSLS